MVKKRESIYSDLKLKWTGPFDLSLMYERLREWLMFMGYGDPATKELKYEEKIKPAGKTVNFHWKCKRSEEEYFELVIEMKFIITRLNDTQAEKDGKMITINKGDVEISFDAYILLDPSGDWKQKGIQNIYDKYISKERKEELIDELKEDIEELMDETKTFLSLYKF